jgi:hypothetical protein
VIVASPRGSLAAFLVLVASAVAQAAQPVAFLTIAQGSQSGMITYTESVVRTPRAWEELWRKHAEGIRMPTVPPAVDFSRNMVVAVFFGKVPAGQRTAILSIQRENDRLIAVLQMIGPPGPESEDLPQITPFHIVEVPRSSLPVVFRRAKIPNMYQPVR